MIKYEPIEAFMDDIADHLESARAAGDSVTESHYLDELCKAFRCLPVGSAYWQKYEHLCSP